jgi:hypothetical protein
MTTNQKILIALGLGTVAFYVYKMRGQKDKGAITKPQSQDNKGQNPPTLPKPQRGQTYEDVVRMGGGGINPPHLQKLREERAAMYQAIKQKYGSENGGKEGDRVTTSYGTYEYVKKKNTSPLAQSPFWYTWEKK